MKYHLLLANLTRQAKESSIVPKYFNKKNAFTMVKRSLIIIVLSTRVIKTNLLYYICQQIMS